MVRKKCSVDAIILFLRTRKNSVIETLKDKFFFISVPWQTNGLSASFCHPSETVGDISIGGRSCQWREETKKSDKSQSLLLRVFTARKEKRFGLARSRRLFHIGSKNLWGEEWDFFTQRILEGLFFVSPELNRSCVTVPKTDSIWGPTRTSLNPPRYQVTLKLEPPTQLQLGGIKLWCKPNSGAIESSFWRQKLR